MKLSLPANISKLRKEHSMTQEQLAEALGVTFASVSKLDLTETYMQIVIGYINIYCKTKNYENALDLIDWSIRFYSGLRNYNFAIMISHEC